MKKIPTNVIVPRLHYDTLKAKAELFDEIHKTIKDGMKRGLEPSMPFALVISKIKAEEFLAKAKELSK